MYVLKPIILLFALTAVLSGCSEKKETPSGSGLLTEEIRGEITISCYDSMNYRNFLEQAARLFEAQYPGTKVKVETFSAMPEIRNSEQGNTRMSMVQNQNDPQGRADYISRINTSLMSGKGADILAMDVLPLHKLVPSGKLENLDPYMQADASFNKQNYRQNILEAVKYHDGTWFLPIDYTFNYYAYDQTLFPNTADFGIENACTGEELFKIGTPVFNGSYKLFNALDYVQGPGGMFNQLLNQQMPAFIDLENRKAHFLNSGFTVLLESVKQYGELGYIPQGITGQQNPAEIMQRTRTEETERYFFKLNSNFALVQQFSRGSGRRLMLRTGGTAGGIEDDDAIAGIEAVSNHQIPFAYTQGFGINAQSKNKTAAWTFLKFLLSEEIQVSTALSPAGLPLHNKAREQKGELLFSGAFMGRGAELDEKQRQSLADYQKAVETLSDQINTYLIQDTVINDMIAEEAAYFFNGSRTAEEAAKVLQNKADLYLNE